MRWIGRSRNLWSNLLIMLFFLAVAIIAKPHLKVVEDRNLSGPFGVVDGDTLMKGSERLRLKGMDAPELSQSCGTPPDLWPCGIAARQALVSLTDGPVLCHVRGRDKYQRLLATCTRETVDIAAEMVRSGHALSYGAYKKEERAAKAARLGVWSGPFAEPGAWRKSHKTEQSGSGWLDWLFRSIR